MADTFHITGPAGVATPTGASTATSSPASTSTSFAALLERLQKLASQPPTPAPIETPDELRAAVDVADRSFTTAMELRQQLEEAFRRHSP
jgi:hypothetical protein